MGAETFFAELRRSVLFGVEDEAALRLLAPHARPHFHEIAEAFYQRLSAHEAARRVFSGPEQVDRLVGTLVVWLEGLLIGPWDEAYFHRQARIGRRHVEIELPQLFLFGAMDHIRIALSRIADLAFQGDVDQRLRVSSALHKVLDMELAIMLETYREAFIERLQYPERLEKANLERRLAVTPSAQYDEVVENGEALITTMDASGEEHDLAARTQRAERLASLGTIAAGLADEIRNPLNAAHLQLSVARRRLARSSGDPGAARAVDLAGAEMARLAGLVEDFLQFARPQPLRLERVDLRVFARDTVFLVEPEAAALGVTLELADGSPIFVALDREKMKQVLFNLVRNALEAAGRGGRVRIDVQEHGESALLTVEDNGLGFPEDAPVFEPFFTTKVGGTGLGLAIVHRIVGDHGGTVSASSRPGNTTRFSVVLPIGHAKRDDGTVTI